MNLKSQNEWTDYCKSGNKPDDIPSDPSKVYKNDGWTSLGNFLGTGRIADHLKPYRTYAEAREFSSNLKFECRNDWFIYIKTGNKPEDIPSLPSNTYKNTGWISWGDFLGNNNLSWKEVGFNNNKEIYEFLISIKVQLENLDMIELITIIRQSEGGFFYDRIAKNENFKKLINSYSEEEKQNAIDDLLEDYSHEDYIENGDLDLINGVELDTEIEELIPETKTSDILTSTNKIIKQLKALDECKITASLDDEIIEFLNKRKLNELWNKYMNNELDMDIFNNSHGGNFYENIKDIFVKEHNYVKNWNWEEELPTDRYIFPYKPNLMQKLFAKRVIDNRRYGNWSGVGAGKTLAAIMATKLTQSQNTLIITFNSTTENWEKNINSSFANNHVMIKQKNPKFIEGVSNYLILNYEFFQQENSENVVYDIMAKNKIDFIILDEVHLTKQRDETISKRREVILKLLYTAEQNNPDVYQIAMSATPVVNNLFEAKTLLEMLMLENYNELDTTASLNNALQIYQHLVINGIRYKPKYDISVEVDYPEIDGSSIIEDIRNVGKGKVIEMERALLDLKLNNIIPILKNGTIIYTEYVDKLIEPIKLFCENQGYKVGFYTGENKTGFNKFLKKEVDILIGSKPISTGVDGLQHVSDNLIILSLPWTNADYEQLVGRIYRQGSIFGNVKVTIPRINIDIDCETWSWDKDRLDRIIFKKTLGDCAVDGIIPSDKIMSPSALLNKARKALDEWIERIENDEIISVERTKIVFPLESKIVEKLQKKLGDFSELNRRWSISNSSTIKERLDKDNTEWLYYHSLYKESRKTWPEIPYLELSKKVSIRPEWVIGDFGCGENLMAKEITNKVHAFDYVAIDESVIACDISNVPLEDNTLDVAVFSLSLMGDNYKDYLKEGYRTLKPYGQLFICEPASKWEGRESELKEAIERVGFRCFGTMRNSDKFIYIDGIKY